MAYFKQGSRQEEWTDDNALYDDEYEDNEEYDEDYLTEEEQNDLRRYRFRMAAGLLDFLSVVAGAVVILLLVALLVNIVTWLQADIDQIRQTLDKKVATKVIPCDCLPGQCHCHHAAESFE